MNLPSQCVPSCLSHSNPATPLNGHPHVESPLDATIPSHLNPLSNRYFSVLVRLLKEDVVVGMEGEDGG
ncbi:hypothetical protein VNO78_16622 [Psophocarpus tetragonolobus]|uniref:Uncharacterized protein n=1 Tax=Psophocarpus tetragonolobus TaxID=3891 RepID=A0AAN9SFY4_PSOTE